MVGNGEGGSGAVRVNGDGGLAATPTTATSTTTRDSSLSAVWDDAPLANAQHTENRINQVLVLLDMNGTLLFRAKKTLRVSKNGGAGGEGGARGGEGSEQEEEGQEVITPAFVHGEPVPLQYYMRPGAAELVAAMDRHPRVQLAFYTSMRGANALPAARFLMHGGGGGGGDGDR